MSSAGSDPLTLLAVATQPLLAQVRRIVAHTRWQLIESGLIRDAAQIVRRHASLVVLCDAVLPDGGWRELLSHSSCAPQPPPVIVAAGQADEQLWLDVLNGGAYNLVAKPLEDQELYETVSRAWLHRRSRTLSQAG